MLHRRTILAAALVSAVGCWAPMALLAWAVGRAMGWR
jgi:hypothetical protein